MAVDPTRLGIMGEGHVNEAYVGALPTFEPPTVEYPGGPPSDRLFGRMKFPRGITVLKNGASYVALENPTDEQVAAADAAYVGGRTHEIFSLDEVAALEAAGYEVQGP